jgi:hypothetical protein
MVPANDALFGPPPEPIPAPHRRINRPCIALWPEDRHFRQLIDDLGYRDASPPVRYMVVSDRGIHVKFTDETWHAWDWEKLRTGD